MNSPAIRAALERLVFGINESGHWLAHTDAFTTAHAALAAAPEWEGPTDQELDDFIARVWPHSPGEMPDDEWRHDMAETIRAAVDEIGLSHWGRSAAPPAPLEGEVGELVAMLRSEAVHDEINGHMAWLAPADARRAATLLSQLAAAAPAVVPVAVSERLPDPNVKVLAHYFNDLGKGRTVCAIWVPAKTRSDSYGDDDFTEYDEETDNFYWPEGWYEAIENWDDLGWAKVDEGEVVYWQPLPKWPAHAIPIPAPQGGEVEG